MNDSLWQVYPLTRSPSNEKKYKSLKALKLSCPSTRAMFSRMDDTVNKEFSLCTIWEFDCLKRPCHQHRRNDFKQMASGFGNRLRQRLRPIIYLAFVNDGIDVHTRGPAEDVIEHTRVPGLKWISIMYRTILSILILSAWEVCALDLRSREDLKQVSPSKGCSSYFIASDHRLHVSKMT